ncbi:hypothetical protein GFL91_29630 [Rhizobium leguminosarum bv. viciae]|uniref:Uncharacterized protein n=1 Tax=Rhizobium leguminosarum bv. viciae TaxID=387 RepID=A0A8I2GW41_RHILV|nr:hypothetical protein [Rhizobium leguminosarum bv. viciae]NKM99257.1 hypothetical protein [Rhizobium leguminosarum bv. viciae]TCA03049.1 hypothetical protein E0H57_19715 [Rhizobium leguminosarum bv. viciae]
MRLTSRCFSLLTKTAKYSIVMLGLVPSICIRSTLDRQQILGTRPRMTPSRTSLSTNGSHMRAFIFERNRSACWTLWA